MKKYKCKECGIDVETSIEVIEKEQLCFTHFRWGIGKKIFEKSDLFRF